MYSQKYRAARRGEPNGRILGSRKVIGLDGVVGDGTWEDREGRGGGGIRSCSSRVGSGVGNVKVGKRFDTSDKVIDSPGAIVHLERAPPHHRSLTSVLVNTVQGVEVEIVQERSCVVSKHQRGNGEGAKIDADVGSCFVEEDTGEVEELVLLDGEKRVDGGPRGTNAGSEHAGSIGLTMNTSTFKTLDAGRKI